MSEIATCKHCGKKVQKINIPDHERACLKDLKTSGLGGWLILVQIGFWLSALIIARSTISLLNVFKHANVYNVSAFFLSLAFTSILAYSLVLMYLRKKEFPNWAIFTLWYSFVYTVIISLLLSKSQEEMIGDIIKSLIAPLIWTAYFKMSIRVKNTFVK